MACTVSNECDNWPITSHAEAETYARHIASEHGWGNDQPAAG